MSEPTDRQDTTEAAEVERLRDEVAKLKGENDELKRETAEATGAASASSGGARRAVAVTGVLIASLLIGLAVPAVWLNRMVGDTEWYVRTVAPLAQNADIQNAVAAKASDAVILKLDAETRLKSVLPTNLQILAAPVGAAVDEFVRKQTTTLVKSEQFAQLWVTVNRASHKALVAAVTGRDGAVLGVEAGTFTLDVSALAEAVKTKLVDAGLGFAANIPTTGLSNNLVLYHSPMLAQMTTVVNDVSNAALWLPLLGIVLAGAAIAVAEDRRRAVVWLGAGVTVAGILPLNIIYLSQYYTVNQVQQAIGIPSPAAQAAFQIIFRDLISADQLLTLVGIIVWVGAVAVGPARWAVALRTGMSGGLSGVASHLELGRFGEWVAARRKGLRLAGIPVVILLLLAMPAPRTITQVVWLTVLLLLLWILAVEFVGSAGTGAATGDGETSEPKESGATTT